jgi:hypothetical protein
MKFARPVVTVRALLVLVNTWQEFVPGCMEKKRDHDDGGRT